MNEITSNAMMEKLVVVIKKSLFEKLLSSGATFNRSY